MPSSYGLTMTKRSPIPKTEEEHYKYNTPIYPPRKTRFSSDPKQDISKPCTLAQELCISKYSSSGSIPESKQADKNKQKPGDTTPITAVSDEEETNFTESTPFCYSSQILLGNKYEGEETEVDGETESNEETEETSEYEKPTEYSETEFNEETDGFWFKLK